MNTTAAPQKITRLRRTATRPTGVKDLDELAERLDAARETFTTLGRELRESRSRGARRRAELADERATADAMSDGAKDPGSKHVDALDAKIDALARQTAAAGIVAEDLAEQYATAIADARPALLKDARKTFADLDARSEEVLVGLVEHLAAVQAARDHASWILHGPEGRGRPLDPHRETAQFLEPVREHLDRPHPLDEVRPAGLVGESGAVDGLRPKRGPSKTRPGHTEELEPDPAA